MNRIALLLLLALALAVAVWALVLRPIATTPAPPDRTVVLHMSGYAFNDSNPTLRFRPGERVRFVLQNDEETRILHDFRFVGFAAPPESVILPGESRTFVVTMPRAGRYGYTCSTHRGMGGAIVVTGASPRGG
jgi:plastocyanin